MVSESLNNEFDKYFNKMSKSWNDDFRYNFESSTRKVGDRSIGLIKTCYNSGHYNNAIKIVSEFNKVSKEYSTKGTEEYISTNFLNDKIINMKTITGRLEEIIKKQKTFTTIQQNFISKENPISFF